ncbi:MAG TPA: hypothetical protein VML92_02805 [Steroidobacteraceae bacterium]|nr:hypothetical protein [Steroidobacteraceae bacterium]
MRWARLLVGVGALALAPLAPAQEATSLEYQVKAMVLLRIAQLVTESDVPSGVDRVLSKPPRLLQLREALAAIVQSEEQR